MDEEEERRLSTSRSKIAEEEEWMDVGEEGMLAAGESVPRPDARY
jgi:hypothetical protein